MLFMMPRIAYDTEDGNSSTQIWDPHSPAWNGNCGIPWIEMYAGGVP